MAKVEFSNLSDQELLVEAKKMKSASTKSALVIGVMFGVIIYSAVKNTLGFFTLIPLFFIYKIVKNSKAHEELKNELKVRGLK
jgi:riboflavin transporter FmnP